MGRQSKASGTVAASGRNVRLDPRHLPVRFAAPDAAADGGERRITLERERVVMSRRVGRVAMRIAVPLVSYQGVIVRLVPGVTEDEDRVAIILAHPDRALDVPLFETGDDEDVVAQWQLWGNTLGLPLLIEARDGSMTAADVREGGLTAERAKPRRRHSLLSGRRPRFLVRRKVGRVAEQPVVLHEWREIIARD